MGGAAWRTPFYLKDIEMSSMRARRKKIYKETALKEYTKEWEKKHNIVLRPKKENIIISESVSDNELCPYCQVKRLSDYKNSRPQGSFNLHKFRCKKKHEAVVA